MYISRRIISVSCLLLSFVVMPFVAHGQSATSVTCLNLTTNLTVGSTDKEPNGPVTQLQEFLRAQGHFTASSTGYFGNVTKTAVQKFQTAQGIDSTGYVGPLTRAKIQELTCSTTSLPTDSSKSLTITSPNQPVTWNMGSSQTVRWNEIGIGNENIEVHLTQSNGSSCHIESLPAKNKQFTFTFETFALYKESSTCDLIIEDGGIYNVQLYYFKGSTIVQSQSAAITAKQLPKALKVKSSNNFQQYSQGDAIVVTFENHKVGEEYDIKLQNTKGVKYNLATRITARSTDLHTEEIIIPRSIPDGNYRVYVAQRTTNGVACNKNVCAEDFSDSAIKIGNSGLKVTNPPSNQSYTVGQFMVVAFNNHIFDQYYSIYLENNERTYFLKNTIGQIGQNHREVIEIPASISEGSYLVKVVQATYYDGATKRTKVCARNNCAQAYSPGVVTVKQRDNAISAQVTTKTTSSKDGEIIFEYNLTGATGGQPVTYWEVETTCPEGVRAYGNGTNTSLQCNKKYKVEMKDNNGNASKLYGRLTNNNPYPAEVGVQVKAIFVEPKPGDDEEKIIGGDNKNITVPGIDPITVVSPNGGETLINTPGALIKQIKWRSTNIDNKKITIKLISENGTVAKILATDIANTGTYNWYGNKDIASGKYMINISVIDATTVAQDYSDQEFKITTR